MDIGFRMAGKADIPVILAFMQSLYAQDHLSFEGPAVRPTLSGIVRDPALGRVWIIEEGDEPIGYMILTLGYSLEHRGRDAFVDELFVREDRRRRGIGRRAMEEMERACRKLGVRALHLVVERPNTAARSLYRKLGFADQERVLMTKPIAG